MLFSIFLGSTNVLFPLREAQFCVSQKHKPCFPFFGKHSCVSHGSQDCVSPFFWREPQLCFSFFFFLRKHVCASLYGKLSCASHGFPENRQETKKIYPNMGKPRKPRKLKEIMKKKHVKKQRDGGWEHHLEHNQGPKSGIHGSP